MKNIAVFVSGNGSNIENIQKYIKSRKLNNPERSDSIQIKMVFTDNKNAYALTRCQRLRLPYHIFDMEDMNNGNLLDKMIDEDINFVVLAGFLKLVHKDIIDYFNRKIINIHPALLPKYGGKGMYGMVVHRKVIENKESFSGISIHYVNEKYDDGDIIIKQKQKIYDSDTPEIVANKIHALEYQWYPITIYSLCSKI